MKAIFALAAAALLLTGCNAMTAGADKMMNKQSSFSQKDNTIYPTVDGTKDGEVAQFGQQKF